MIMRCSSIKNDAENMLHVIAMGRLGDDVGIGLALVLVAPADPLAGIVSRRADGKDDGDVVS